MAQAHGREAGEGDASPSDLWPKELRGKVGNPGQFSSLFLHHLSWGKRTYKITGNAPNSLVHKTPSLRGVQGLGLMN